MSLCKKLDNPPQKKSTYCVIPFIQNSQKYKLIYCDRNQINNFLSVGGRQGHDEGITKGHKEMFG